MDQRLEARGELRGERTGIRYGAGAKLRVQVSRVDLDARKIDFRLVREGAERVAEHQEAPEDDRRRHRQVAHRDPQDVQAQYLDGILEITLPRKAPLIRQIPVKQADRE